MPEQTTLGNIHVEAEFRKIPVFRKMELKNLFGNYHAYQDASKSGVELPLGLIENTALKYALKSLRVGNEEVKIDQGQPLKNLPDYDDDDYLEEIDEWLMTGVVKTNKFLARKQPYMGVFQQFLPEEERPNPTPPPTETPTPGTSSTEPAVTSG